MKCYADYEFYVTSYLLGRNPAIPEKGADYWFMLASEKIREQTFDRLDNVEEIPEKAKMCCCEAAEKLYSFEAAKEGNGMILQSYGNDGETGTYKSDDMSERAVKKSVCGIIRKWLGSSGLLYCGV